MSNTNTVRYKQPTRQTRIQTREGEFASGMFFTDKPLAAGYSKLLVNYDINPVDGTLNPRRGFQSKSAATTRALTDKDWINIDNTSPFITDSHMQNGASYFSENSQTLSMIACEPDSGSVYFLQQEADLSTKEADLKNKDGSKGFYDIGLTCTPLSEGVDAGRYNYKKDYYQMILKTINNPRIHGQNCFKRYDDSTDYFFRKPIGTFAFGDKYYFFSHLEFDLKTPFATLEDTTLSFTVTDAPHLVPCIDLETKRIFPGYWNADTTELYPYTNIPAGSTLNFNIDQTKNSSGNKYNPTITTLQIPITTAGVTFDAFIKAYYMSLDKGQSTSTSLKFDTTRRKENLLGTCVQFTNHFYIPTKFTITGNSTSITSYDFNEYTIYGYYTAAGSGSTIRAVGYAADDVPNPISIIEDAELHYIKDTTLDDTVEGVSHIGNISATGNAEDFIINPQLQNPSEAASTGYNMLAKDPYNFVCETGANISILGILPYDSSDELVLTPIMNTDLVLKCFYRAPSTTKKYRVKWEWREVGATVWTLIQESTEVNFSTLSLNPLTCNFRSAVEQLIIRVTISDPNNTVTQADGTTVEYVESTTSIGMNLVTVLTASRQKVKPVRYDLGTAQGMLEWKSRLFLWGVENAETMIFTSDVNNPTFFPYPNNIDVFDEPVMHCIHYGDDMLVFTSTKLYRLTFDESGITWSKTVVQKDLQITPQDIPMFCRVKNMLFFKSGNYYYMLVPKSSSIVGETTIAPVSNPMKQFFDNFNIEVQKVFKLVSQNLGRTYGDPNRPITDFLCNYYSYVDNQNVVLNFVYSLNNYCYDDVYYQGVPQRYWTCALIYDTENYTWKIHTYVSPRILNPVQINALGQSTYAYLIPWNAYRDRTQPCVICSEKDSIIVQDNFITWINNSTNEVGPCYDYVQCWSKNLATMELKNHQYFDSGYRTLTSSIDLKKRFREIQFSINNVSQKALTFYTSFILDGQLRKDMQGYNTKIIIDPNDPKTGILLVERPYINPSYLPEFTVSIKDYVNPDVTPGDTTLDDSFVLDNTKFPDLAYWKVRVSISGKGYTPRLQILSLNDLDYNILSTNWVYRTMNSR
jgi:hypothetical protein